LLRNLESERERERDCLDRDEEKKCGREREEKNKLFDNIALISIHRLQMIVVRHFLDVNEAIPMVLILLSSLFLPKTENKILFFRTGFSSSFSSFFLTRVNAA
jgi:hypothetical protein